MKTYFITGGAGFIGSHYIRYLLNSYDDINIINFDKLTYAGNLENLSDVQNDARYFFVRGDICDAKGISEIFSKEKIDFVVNFAAESHVDRSIENPSVFVETNVNGTVNLLNAALNNWADRNENDVKFLQVSTDEVYGSLGETGLFLESTPLDPRSPYSASKAGADMLVKAYHDTYRLPINITRCSNNYGAFQFPEKLVPLMICNALKLKNLPVYGDGMQVRDWLYVEDHCHAIELVLQNAKSGEIYNIGGNNEKANIDMVITIIKYLSEKDASITPRLITHVTDRKGHDRRYAIDASKIKRELGWEPKTSFHDGIKKTIEWYCKNEKWLTNVNTGEYQAYYARMYDGR